LWKAVKRRKFAVLDFAKSAEAPSCRVGKPERRADDMAVLRLRRRLSEWTGWADGPFGYAESKALWIAYFECGSGNRWQQAARGDSLLLLHCGVSGVCGGRTRRRSIEYGSRGRPGAGCPQSVDVAVTCTRHDSPIPLQEVTTVNQNCSRHKTKAPGIGAARIGRQAYCQEPNLYHHHTRLPGLLQWQSECSPCPWTSSEEIHRLYLVYFQALDSYAPHFGAQGEYSPWGQTGNGGPNRGRITVSVENPPPASFGSRAEPRGD